jgi:cell division protein ZapA
MPLLLHEFSDQEELRMDQDLKAPLGENIVAESIVVDIYDQSYHLRGPDPKYLQQLAALVDAKMRAVAQQGATVDSLRVAVLAALNIADELVILQQKNDAHGSQMGQMGQMQQAIKTRAETLAEMLDAVLDGTRKAG